MRFAAILPVPGMASAAQVLDFATAAEESGYDAVYMNSRVARPVHIESRHPYTPDGGPPWPADVNWPDAFVLFSFIAAHTTRLRFGPVVVPVIVTHPLTLAKQAATLDVYSSGRFELGLGAGWMLEESEAVARPVDLRWQRLEETVEILRLAWSSTTFSYAGRCYRIPEVGQHPHPLQGAGLPIWIGGHGQRALEIAARAGAGLFLWGGYPPDKAADYARRVRALNPETKVATLVSLTANPDGIDALVSELEAAGIDLIAVSGRFSSYDERRDAMWEFGTRFASARRG